MEFSWLMASAPTAAGVVVFTAGSMNATATEPQTAADTRFQAEMVGV
jgi:hypothetical protein